MSLPLFVLASFATMGGEAPSSPRERDSRDPSRGQSPSFPRGNVVAASLDSSQAGPFVSPVRPLPPELRVACPRSDCRAEPGQLCNRRTLAQKSYHLDRVLAAARLTGQASPASIEAMK